MTSEEYKRECERIRKFRDYQIEIEELEGMKENKDKIDPTFCIGTKITYYKKPISEKIKEATFKIIEDRIKECWDEIDKI